MVSTAALIVAAGSGSRAGSGLPKQFRFLAGNGLRHAYDALRAIPHRRDSNLHRAGRRSFSRAISGRIRASRSLGDRRAVSGPAG